MLTMQPGYSIEQFLQRLPRRYRLPELANGGDAALMARPDGNRFSVQLAVILEQARQALAAGATPPNELAQAFVQAMAEMIQEAAQATSGDPVFQAMVLERQEPLVREFSALSSQFQQDKRRVQGLINAIAHPEKLQRHPPGPLNDALSQLGDAGAAAQWSRLPALLQEALSAPDTRNDSNMADTLTQIREAPALQRLIRLDILREDRAVKQYLALREQFGPSANSAAAARQGAEGRKRGMGVETLAAQALEVLAQQLDGKGDGSTSYRVVTAMYVPASLSAGHHGAKTEWDVVLLKQASDSDSAAPTFDMCLLLEAKASPDSVGGDLPRLLRGLQLLAAADPEDVYIFRAREGSFPLRGASLSQLPTQPDRLAGSVLYCSDAPAEPHPRLLSAASRMKLLSAPQSLGFAAALVEGRRPDLQSLELLWQQVLSEPEWNSVLSQTLAMEEARKLMVHTDDLLAGAYQL